MIFSKQTGALFILLSGVSVAASELPRQLDPAEQVRAIRQSEDWLNNFKSLYISAEREWIKSPYAIEKARAEIKSSYKIEKPDPNQFKDLLDHHYEIVEFAIDQQRIRSFQLDPTYWRDEKVWDGRQLTVYEKYFNSSQEFYCLDNTIQRHFSELLPCSFGWPRSQPHSPWWDRRNLDSAIEFFGRAEDFTFNGKTDFRGKTCYQLEYIVPEASGLAFRWLVGVDDGLLYGIQTLRNGKKTLEHWWDNYKTVMTTGRFPMKLGWAFYEKGTEGTVLLTTECLVTVREFRVNEPLDDALFTIELREGVDIQDHRSGQMREYTLSKMDIEKTPQTTAEECQIIFSNPSSKKYETKSRFGREGRLSGRPLEGASMRVHEIELSFTVPFNTKAIPKTNVRYGKLQFQDARQTAFSCAILGDQGDRYNQTFYIDLNHNGQWDKDEIFPGYEPTEDNKAKTWFGQVDLMLTNAAGQHYQHRVFAVYNHYDQLYVVSHGWKESAIQIGGKTQNVFLIDYNCDGRFDSGRPICEQPLFLPSYETSHDYIAWDENDNRRLDYDEIHYIGSYSTYHGQIYQIAAKADGSQIAVLPVNIPTGKLQLPVTDAYVRLLGCKGPIAVGGFSEPVTLPADTYWVDYSVYYLPDNEPIKYAKSGQYYHEPWMIKNGQTLTVLRDLLDVSTEDEGIYQQKLESFLQQQENSRLDMLKKEYNSLMGETLIDFSDFEITKDVTELKSSLLVCFWDFSQRPSRHVVGQLAEKKETLSEENIELVLIHTAEMSDNAKKWLAGKELPCHIGSILQESESIRQQWGVRSLPWLILTNSRHAVVAEGFSVNALDEQREKLD